jgi:hypothetical protein
MLKHYPSRKVKLSNVEIDVDKDWTGKKITNVAEINVG